MPIFEFQCDNCGVAFEELLFNSSAIEDLTCPECGSNQIHKMISTFASRIAGGNTSTSFGSRPAASCNTGSV
jgi:putative FmdB family regulatory protein